MIPLVGYIAMTIKASMSLQYDYIIAGGGCAGLSLLYHLLQNPIQQHKKILVIDQQYKQHNDRTWCFWTDQPTLFDEIVYREWKKIQIITPAQRQSHLLQHYTYKVIRGIDFYQKVWQLVQAFPNVEFCQATVLQTTTQAHTAVAQTTVGTFEATYVFDSLFQPQHYSPTATDYTYLLQHFKGWVIRSPKPLFDTTSITMFDFRLPQHQEVRFVYTLPFTAYEALVEFTVFGKKVLAQADYDQLLATYIREQLGISMYDIKEQEFGVIPMTDFRFKKQQGRHLCYIGTRGGASKPTTGYTFLNIQQESQRIVQSLDKEGHPFYQMPCQRHFLLYDQMMLKIMQQNGEQIREIFQTLFANNPIERVLKFLNNETHFGEDLAVMWSVPSLPFLRALWQVL